MHSASLNSSKYLSVWILNSVFCINLCGCSTTSETFDCKPGQGVGCKPISEVNQMVDQQTLGKETAQSKQSILPVQAASFSNPIIATNSPRIETSQGNLASRPAAIPLSDTITVQRIPEEYLRVWIAPSQDQQGNLHEGSVIHTILKPGCWQLYNSPQKVGAPDTSKLTDYHSKISDAKDNDTPHFNLNEDD